MSRELPPVSEIATRRRWRRRWIDGFSKEAQWRSLAYRSLDGLPDLIGCRDYQECVLQSSNNFLDIYITLYREVFVSFSYLCKPDNLT